MEEKFNDRAINVNCTGEYNIIITKKDNFNKEQYDELKQIYKELGFANCKAIENKSEIDIYYNTKSLKTIGEYLSEIYITKIEFVALAENIYNCIQKCKANNILSPKNIMLNIDSIYINPANEKIYLIYAPVHKSITSDIIEDLEVTLKKILRDIIQVRDGDRDFRQQVLEIMNKKDLELEDYTKVRTPKNNSNVHNLVKKDSDIVETTYDDEDYEDSYESKNGLKVFFRDIVGNKLIDIRDDIAKNIDNIKDRFLDKEFDYDETVVLSNKSGYLVNQNKTYTKRIEIDKDEFIIGRFKDAVDYNIVNKSVGKIHAKFIKIRDEFYLIDLDSKNGTYINNNKLKANIPYKLENGSVILFSNVKYIFEIVESDYVYE